jgi:hypothetical protein
MFCALGIVFGGTEGGGSCFHVLRVRSLFHVLTVPRASGPVFTFCAPGLIFFGTEGVRYHFDVLRAQTRFRPYRGCRVSFSCYAHPDLFSAVPGASGLIFMFCAPGIVFGGTEGGVSCFHVLHARTCFRPYRWRRATFSCFARPDSFSAVPRASGPVFMFCSPGLVFSGFDCVGPLFHVLRSWTSFRLYRGRRVRFSCFARPDSFSAVERASGPIFMFSSPDSFSAVPRASGSFSCFALPDSFSAVPMASGLVFLFCAPGHVFDGSEGIGSRFHDLCPELIFSGTEGVGSHFNILRVRTRFRRYRGRRVPFSCFARTYTFSAVTSASGAIFMFCAPELFFGRTEGVGYCFRVFRTILVFGGTENVGSRFPVLHSRTRFRRYRGCQVPF